MFRPTTSLSTLRSGPLPGRHARLGTRLLARVCRGRHFRRLSSMRFQGATRTDPYLQNSRIRLLPRVVDGETIPWPWMKDSWPWKPFCSDFPHPLPCDFGPLAATRERSPPELGHTISERLKRPKIRWHCMIGEPAGEDLPQPFPLFGGAIRENG